MGPPACAGVTIGAATFLGLPMLLVLALSTSPAHAAGCDALVAGVDALTPETAGAAYAALAACDRKPAEVNFLRFVKQARTDEGVAAVFLAAVEADTWSVVGGALGKLPARATNAEGEEIDLRGAIAVRLGEACAEHPKVAAFLQDAHTSLKTAEFQPWTDAWLACESEPLRAYTAAQVAAPPSTSFDERYTTLVDVYAKQLGTSALPVLSTAAIQAATTGGPYDALLEAMGRTARNEAGRTALAEALVGVARKVDPARATRIGFTLAENNAEAAAASLLPAIYADRVQKNGGFLYGAVAVEAGTCDGKKTAVLHVAQVTEPGKVWSIAPAVEATLRAAKPKLKGCEGTATWPVLTSPTPVASGDDVEAWARTLEVKWIKDGYEVKVQKEKPVGL